MSPGRIIAFDLLLVVAIAFGLTLIATSPWRHGAGIRRGRFALLPLAGGGATLVAVAILWAGDAPDIARRLWGGDSYPDTFHRSALRAAAVGVATLTGVASGDFLLARVSPLVARALRLGGGGLRIREAQFAAVSALFVLSGGALGLLAALSVLDESGGPLALDLTGSSRVTVEARYRLPGWPMGAAVVDARSGYLTIYPDRIVRFELPNDPGGELVLETVAAGLQFPRALAVLDGRLYVSELGELLCDDPGLSPCRPEGMTRAEAEYATIESSRGRIIAFTIGGAGDLTFERVVLTDLPVVNHEHGLNALVAGPDGRLYASVGGFDRLAADADLLHDLSHPRLELVGTVLAITPATGEFEVFARGLRNLYDLAWDPAGRLFTSDNDGISQAGWRAEEVLVIERGANYGFPLAGTFDWGPERTGFPIWVHDGVGSSGIAWAGDVGLGDGLLIGSTAALTLLELEVPQDGSRPSVRTKLERRLLEFGGWPTVVEPLDSNRLLVAVLAFTALESELIVLLTTQSRACRRPRSVSYLAGGWRLAIRRGLRAGDRPAVSSVRSRGVCSTMTCGNASSQVLDHWWFRTKSPWRSRVSSLVYASTRHAGYSTTSRSTTSGEAWN